MVWKSDRSKARMLKWSLLVNLKGTPVHLIKALQGEIEAIKKKKKGQYVWNRHVWKRTELYLALNNLLCYKNTPLTSEPVHEGMGQITQPMKYILILQILKFQILNAYWNIPNTDWRPSSCQALVVSVLEIFHDSLGLGSSLTWSGYSGVPNASPCPHRCCQGWAVKSAPIVQKTDCSFLLPAQLNISSGKAQKEKHYFFIWWRSCF